MRKVLNWILLAAMLITLLPLATIAAPLAQEEVTCAEEYTVQADDWLSKIADKYLGDIMAYPAIVAATNQKNAADDTFAKIDNPDVIEIGWKVCIPTTEYAQAALLTSTAPAGERQKLILATTTSTADSGLLDFILPDFENAYNCDVDVVAVGTGQALEIGTKGDADVLLVHARAREDQFMADGHGSRREDVMYNDFVILGPASDPAGIKGKGKASKALTMIAEAAAPFVSRGDDSGTHTKEKAVWAEAGTEPAGDWYISAGQGMGAVLTMANEQQAYTLSDRATYLARTLEGIDLEIMVEGDPILFNPYGVMAVNPNKGEHIKADLANTFIDWLISVPLQEKIGEFGKDKFGAPLFTPDSAPYKAAQQSGAAEPTGGEVALKITGAVANQLGWLEDEVRAMETAEAQDVNNAGETETYTGVSLNKLLEMAGVQEGATTITFVADDGYEASAAWEEVQACADCIVSFRTQGGFSMVMPGFPKNLRVKGVVEIKVEGAEAAAPAELAGKLIIFHAGSLTVPLDDLVGVFKTKYPDVTFETEASGSNAAARKISELGREADLMMSADYAVIDQLLIPDFADWNILFARNTMVIAYTDQSQYAAEINADNWYDILTRDGVIYGHSEPDADPCGYRTLLVWQLAEKHYGVEGLYDKLEAHCPPENVRPKSVELIALLESGDMDYAFEYRSVAVQHNMKFVELPDEINLSTVEYADFYAQAATDIAGADPGTTMTMVGSPIVYGVTIPKNAPSPALALEFVKFLIGPDGQAVMDKQGQPPIVPAVAADKATVSAELQDMVQ